MQNGMYDLIFNFIKQIWHLYQFQAFLVITECMPDMKLSVSTQNHMLRVDLTWSCDLLIDTVMHTTWLPLIITT